MKKFDSLPIIFIGLLLCFFYPIIFSIFADNVTQSVTVVSDKEKEKMAMDWEVRNCEIKFCVSCSNLDSDIYSSGDNTYEFFTRHELTKNNPYNNKIPLFKLITKTVFGTATDIGTAQEIKSLKCKRYLQGKEDIEYWVTRKEKEAKEKELILLQKDSLNDLECN